MMKRMFRSVLMLMVGITLTLSLSSCVALDEARDRHMYYSEDKSEITFRGETYKKCEIADYDIMSSAPWDSYGGADCFVTAPDVPVLLMRYFGSRAYCSDSEFGIIFAYPNYEQVVYCREDLYDEFIEEIVKQDYSALGASYIGLDQETGECGWKYLRLSSEDTKKLRDAVSDSGVEKEFPFGDEFYDYGFYSNTGKYMLLSPCTERGYQVKFDETSYAVYTVDGADYVYGFEEQKELPLDKEAHAALADLYAQYREAVVAGEVVYEG